MSETKIPQLDTDHKWIRIGEGKRDHISYAVAQDCHTECGQTVEASRIRSVEKPSCPCSICVDVYELS